MTETFRRPLARPDADWRRSSYCNGANSTCVEVAVAGESIRVRDSKNVTAPALVFTAEEWHAFVRGVRAGEFDVGPIG